MPWWAWFLVDVVVVLTAVGLDIRAYWNGWKVVRAFFREMSAILAEVPRVRR